jgi:hypothetical protein
VEDSTAAKQRQEQRRGGKSSSFLFSEAQNGIFSMQEAV